MGDVAFGNPGGTSWGPNSFLGDQYMPESRGGWRAGGFPSLKPWKADDAPKVSPGLAIAAGVFGDLSRAYANFAAVRMGQYEAKSQASSLSHRARMLDLDRRSAERRAESILEAGQQQASVARSAGRQAVAVEEADAAARGVDSSVGSAAEVLASEDLMAAMDVYHINLASVQAANAERTGAVAIGNEALFARTGARNLRRSVRAADPAAQLYGGLGSAALTTGLLATYKR